MNPAPETLPASAKPSEVVLVARDLDVTLPGSREPVARGVSLSVGAGEWVALTGPNGCGKSTLLLALAGLIPISAGTLTLDGTALRPHERSGAAGRIAVVFQDPSSQLLQPTVERELSFTARNLARPEAEISESVRRWSTAFQLTQELGRDPSTLSAGGQQQVLMASALVSHPRLLVADEPTAHLDAAARARVRELVEQEVSCGLAVVWATQDPLEVAAAHRTLALGATPRRADLPARAPAPASGGAALRLRVAPDPGGDGFRVRVSRPLDLLVAHRGVTALLGENGAGKSVLLRAAAGLSPTPQVVVTWEAQAASAPILAHQFPELQIFEEVVVDELVFAAVARGIPRTLALESARRCLVRLGFEPDSLLSRETWTLSAGEKRLIEVVGALIAPSSLVILDEPTAGLDENRRKALAVLVSERANQDPVLVATQDVPWVDDLEARTVVVVH